MLLLLVDRVNDLKMEDMEYSEWSEQSEEITCSNNSWLPAYGFQTPTTLLERDYVGNRGMYI